MSGFISIDAKTGWGVAGWMYRFVLQELLACSAELVPEHVRTLIEAATPPRHPYLDLEPWPASDLKLLVAALQHVIAVVRARGRSSFGSPEYFDGAVASMENLAKLVEARIAAATETPPRTEGIVESIDDNVPSNSRSAPGTLAKIAKAVTEVTLEAGASAVAAVAAGTDPGVATVQGVVKALTKQLVAPFFDSFREKQRQQDERRVTDGLAAGALASGQTAEEFAHQLEAESHDDWLRTNLREPLRAMIEALDDAAIEPLGRLLADCRGKRDFDRRLLRGLARLLADAPGNDIAGLTTVVRTIVEITAGLPQHGAWRVSLFPDGELTVLGQDGEVGRPFDRMAYGGGVRMLEELGMLHRLISQPELTPMSPTQRPCETFYIADDFIRRLHFYLVAESPPAEHVTRAVARRMSTPGCNVINRG